MRVRTRPAAAAATRLSGLVVMSNRIAFMRRTSPVQPGIASTVATAADAVERNLAYYALTAQMPQRVRQDGERRARIAVRGDQRGVPRHVAAVPMEDVHALDARAEADQLREDVVDRLGGVGERLAGVLDVGAVAALDDAAGLGQPDLAPDGLEQRLGRPRLVLVGVGVVVQAPVRGLLVGRLDEQPGPAPEVRTVDEVGRD